MLFEREELERICRVDLGGDCGAVDTVLLEKNDCCFGASVGTASLLWITFALVNSSRLEGTIGFGRAWGDGSDGSVCEGAKLSLRFGWNAVLGDGGAYNKSF
jgi:hypothetical protein